MVDEWTPIMDKLLRIWLKQINKNSKAHTRLSKTYRRRNIIMGGPAVVIGGFASGANFTLFRQECSYNEVSIVRIIISSMMMFSTALTGLMSFLNYGSRSKEHSNASERYDALSRIINNTLAFDYTARGKPTDIINSIRNQYDHIVNSTPSLKGIIDDELPTSIIYNDDAENKDKVDIDINMFSSGSNMADIHIQENMQKIIRDDKRALPADLKYQISRFNTLS